MGRSLQSESRGPHVRPLHQEIGRYACRRRVGDPLRRECIGKQFGHVLPIAAQEHGEAGLRGGQPGIQLRQAGLRVAQILPHPIQVQ